MKPIKVTDIEQMTTHELGDLLANIVLVLRRLPNVPMIDLQPIERPIDTAAIVANVRNVRQEKTSNGNSGKLPDWTKDEEEIGRE